MDLVVPLGAEAAATHVTLVGFFTWKRRAHITAKARYNEVVKGLL